MAPKKKTPEEDGPPEVFSVNHSSEFEEWYDLPQGSVIHAYRVRFGALAPYVLADLVDNPPRQDAYGNIIWPAPPPLRRRNATAGYTKQGRRRFDNDDEDQLSEPSPPLEGPGLKRANAIRKKPAKPTSPPPRNAPNLQRRGAVRKQYNPVRKSSVVWGRERNGEPADLALIGGEYAQEAGSAWNQQGLRRSARTGRASLSSKGSKGSPDKMDFT